MVIFSGEGSDRLTQGYICFKKKFCERKPRNRVRDVWRNSDVLHTDQTTAAHLPWTEDPIPGSLISFLLVVSATRNENTKKQDRKYFLREIFKDSSLIYKEIPWWPKSAFRNGISLVKNFWFGGFPGGSVVMNLHANMGNTVLIPAPGTSRKPRSN